MINMIRADFYRLIRSKSIYIAIYILVMMIGVSVYLVQPGNIGMSVNMGTVAENELNNMSFEELQQLEISEFREIMLNTEGYALDKDVLAANMNLYYLFIFVVAIVIATEFSGNTIKNTLSSTISRKTYFLSKLTFVNLCCLTIFFLNTYLMYFANIILNGRALASSLGTITKITFLQLPPILALVSILTGLAFILKKTSLFNTVVIPLIMVFQLLLNLMVTLFHIKEDFLDYELQQMLTKLAGSPSDSYVLHSYLICAIVIGLFYILGYLSFQKTEIK